MNTEILKIIEGGLDKDRSKVYQFARQLAHNLKQDGNTRLSRRIQNLIQNKAGDFVTTDALSSPVDHDSRLELLEIEVCREEDDLVLEPIVVQKLNRFVGSVKRRDELRKRGLEMRPSLLLYGPPGCGKSSVARQIARRLELPLVVTRLDAMISSLLGSTAKNIQRAFTFASGRPCVLFLDEFDALAKARDDRNELGELKRVVNSLLQNIDAFVENNVLLAATNHHELLDRAIWRRFDTTIQLPLPDEGARKQMFQACLNGHPFEFRQDERKIETIARLLEKRSHSDIQSLVSNVLVQSALHDRPELLYAEVLLEILTKEGASFSQDETIRYLNKHGATQESIRAVLGLSVRTVRNALAVAAKKGRNA